MLNQTPPRKKNVLLREVGTPGQKKLTAAETNENIAVKALIIDRASGKVMAEEVWINRWTRDCVKYVAVEEVNAELGKNERGGRKASNFGYRKCPDTTVENSVVKELIQVLVEAVEEEKCEML